MKVRPTWAMFGWVWLAQTLASLAFVLILLYPSHIRFSDLFSSDMLVGLLEHAAGGFVMAVPVILGVWMHSLDQRWRIRFRRRRQPTQQTSETARNG